MSDSVSRFDDDFDDGFDDDFDDDNNNNNNGGDDDADDGGAVAAPAPAPAPVAQPAPAPAPAEPAAQVTRLYEAAFNRQPDSEGLALWTNLLQTGTGLDAVADALVASPEFRARFDLFENDDADDDGDGDDFNDEDDFVDFMYFSAFRREPEDAGEDFWEDGLEAGRFDRGDVLLAFSQSPEFLARTAPGNDDPLV